MLQSDVSHRRLADGSEVEICDVTTTPGWWSGVAWDRQRPLDRTEPRSYARLTVDIEAVRRLRERYEAVLDEADAARAAYHQALRDLHRSGVPLRELADQLGMSHQRVHQIVGDATPPAKKRTRRAIGAVSAGSAIVVVVVALMLARERPQEQPPSTQPVAVEVLTQGQSWRFEFPRLDVSISGVSPEIVLPAGTRVSFALRSADVIHSMWVPALAGKQDIVPGRTNTFELRTGAPGTYTGHDAEFAGIRYELANFTVRIVTPPEFDRWLDQVRIM